MAEVKFSWEEAELKPEPAFTLRALIIGFVFGSLITVVNVYMALTIGVMSTAAMISSLMMYLICHTIWGGRRDPGPKEVVTAYNMHQAGAFAWTLYPMATIYLAQHAAFIETGYVLPEWILPNTQTYAEVFAERIVFSGVWFTPLSWMLPLAIWSGIVGLMIASWFRYQVIEVEKLVFPYGMADAEVIRGVTTAKGLVRARWLFYGITLGFLVDFWLNLVPVVWESAPSIILELADKISFKDLTPPLAKIFPGGSFVLLFDIGIIGLAMIMPPAASISMGVSAIIFYVFLATIMVRMGVYEWTPESASGGASTGLFRYPYGLSLAIGMLPTAAVVPVVLQWKVFIRGMKAVMTIKDGIRKADISPRISIGVALLFVVVLGASFTALSNERFISAGDIVSLPFALFLGAMMLVLMLLSTIVDIRTVGETGWSFGLVSGWIYRLLIFGSGYAGFELYQFSGPIMDHSGLGTSQMESFRVGYLMKAKPMHQYVTALLGWTLTWFMSTFFIFGLWSMYGTGSEALPMPNMEAGVYFTIALATRQFSVLYDIRYVAFGVLMGVLFTVIRGIAPVFPIVPITFALGMQLGTYYSTTFMAGGILRILLVRIKGQIWYEERGVPFGAGLLVGGALAWFVGVVIHFAQLFLGG
ncbi:MAG: OPT/YSL family transporter [Candidatus Methanofastidiosia archaeon]